MGTKLMRMVAIGAAGSATLAGAAWAAPKSVNNNARVTDFATTVEDPTLDAQAHIRAEATGDGGTRVRLHITGLDHSAVGRVLGAHVHTGACTTGAGADAAAGPHYRHDAGVATDQNEVWLDFEVQPGGVGDADVVVPFEIPTGGAHSVVIHRDPTNPATPNGAAGPRLGCITADF